MFSSRYDKTLGKKRFFGNDSKTQPLNKKREDFHVSHYFINDFY